LRTLVLRTRRIVLIIVVELDSEVKAQILEPIGGEPRRSRQPLASTGGRSWSLLLAQRLEEMILVHSDGRPIKYGYISIKIP